MHSSPARETIFARAATKTEIRKVNPFYYLIYFGRFSTLTEIIEKMCPKQEKLAQFDPGESELIEFVGFFLGSSAFPKNFILTLSPK